MAEPNNAPDVATEIAKALATMLQSPEYQMMMDLAIEKGCQKVLAKHLESGEKPESESGGSHEMEKPKDSNDSEGKLDYIIGHLESKAGSAATPTSKTLASYLRPNGQGLPSGFVIPAFIRFSGKGDPAGHIKHFANLMNLSPLDMKQATGLFAFSLEGNALEWYNGLKFSIQGNWDELVAAFTKQYEINTLQKYTWADLAALR
ncbi:hypothetical protein M5689_006560 [Euphorbia peplus]|nr:hypothetical protein M5689_006560 [Euphorbia peplus]